MRAFVQDSGGQVFQLPRLLEFELEYGVGTPCDSFRLCCPWQADNPTHPGDWTEFYAEAEGERVFTGVVDECRISLTGRGRLLEVEGRGMAARLLDNEALGQDYDLALWELIEEQHIAPFGIRVVGTEGLPAQSRFRVDTGSSCWTVTEQFLRAAGGRPIRFDQWGQMVLSPWEDGVTVLLDGTAPITRLERRDRRYGVLSQVLVRDRYSGRVERVRNEAFCAAGGQTGRVLTMPGHAGTAEMIRAGQEQLERSAREQVQVEVTLAAPFALRPGELVQLRRGDPGVDGLYRVQRCTVGLDRDGYWTRALLRLPECVR